MSHLAANVRRLRKEKTWSQDELTRRSGVTSVKMIEVSKVACPRYPTLVALARALGVTVADLFAEPKHPKRKRLNGRPRVRQQRRAGEG